MSFILVALAPFSAGDFSAGVGGQGRNEPPLARHLPGGQGLKQKLSQFHFRGVRCDDGDHHFRPPGVAAGRAEDEAFAHLRRRGACPGGPAEDLKESAWGHVD